MSRTETDGYKWIVLDAFMNDELDNGRFTSQDICDNLRETVALSPDDVTQYLIAHDYSLERRDDRLVWVRL